MDVTITLKKALDIAKAASEAAGRIKVQNSVKISIYGSVDVENTIYDASEKVRAAVDDTVSLITAHYNIKRQIGELNDRVGVTTAMRQKAKYEAIEKKLVAMIKLLEGSEANIYTRDTAMEAKDLEAIRSRIKLSRDRIENKDSTSGTEEIFAVTVMSDDYIETLTTEMLRVRRAKLSCSDSIAALNVHNSITLDDADVDVLRKHSIL
jgi:hypothetical protein